MDNLMSNVVECKPTNKENVVGLILDTKNILINANDSAMVIGNTMFGEQVRNDSPAPCDCLAAELQVIKSLAISIAEELEKIKRGIGA